MEGIFNNSSAFTTSQTFQNSAKGDSPSCLRLELNTTNQFMCNDSNACELPLSQTNSSGPFAAKYNSIIYPPLYPWMRNRAKGACLASSTNDSTKRTRATYSQNQRLDLEKEFHFAQYITLRRRAQIAKSLRLTERQVKVWFQNRRMKWKKYTMTTKKEKQKSNGQVYKTSQDSISFNDETFTSRQKEILLQSGWAYI